MPPLDDDGSRHTHENLGAGAFARHDGSIDAGLTLWAGCAGRDSGAKGLGEIGQTDTCPVID